MISLSDYMKQELNRASENEMIIALKKLMSEEQRKESFLEYKFYLNQYPKIPFTGDLYAEKGIDGLGIKVPVMVEVRGGLLMPTFQRELRKGMEYVKNKKDEIYLVVYANTSLTDVPKAPSKNVLFIHYDKILRKVKKADRDGIPTVEGGGADVSIPQDKLIGDAAKALGNGTVTFILGSGVSVDAGSPQWDDLLKGLMKTNAALSPLGDREGDYQSISSHCGWSPLITARYVINDSEKNKELIKKMRELIYANSKKCKYKSSPTALPIIAKTIKNCKVESVITFNYDEFLEEALDKEKYRYSSFYNKGALGSEFPVFHVHGFISRKKRSGVATRPVLSEKEYHSLYSDDFHWSNVEILRALMRTTCFFVGLSMTDPNLRRLLDIARKEDDRECPHYLFLRKSPLDKTIPNVVFDTKHQRQVERQFAQMGVNVIWFDYNSADPKDFSDLARILEQIYNQASHKGEE